MKVKELIKELEKLDQDKTIFISDCNEIRRYDIFINQAENWDTKEEEYEIC